MLREGTLVCLPLMSAVALKKKPGRNGVILEKKRFWLSIYLQEVGRRKISGDYLPFPYLLLK